jgi:hypothetical protein
MNLRENIQMPLKQHSHRHFQQILAMTCFNKQTMEDACAPWIDGRTRPSIGDEPIATGNFRLAMPDDRRQPPKRCCRLLDGADAGC